MGATATQSQAMENKMNINAYPSRRELMAAAATLAAAVPARNLLADEQAAPATKGDAGPKIVNGTVFESSSGARKRQLGDPRIAGVPVSKSPAGAPLRPHCRFRLAIYDG